MLRQHTDSSAPQGDPLHVFVRPLTTRDDEACQRISQSSRDPPLSLQEVGKLTSSHSSTTLGIFTTPADLRPSTSRPPTPSLAPHAEIALGFVVGVLDEGCGEGATLHILGIWVLPEAEDRGVGQVLLKAFCERMKDARVARKLEKSMSSVAGEGMGEREKVLAWFREAGFAVRDAACGGSSSSAAEGAEGGGLKLVADCY